MDPEVYGRVLQEYLESGVLKRMLDEGYATLAAKSAGYPGARGPGYHIDQSHRTHILNGLFAITRLTEYLARHELFALDEVEFRRLLVLYTTHDTHKLPSAEKHGRGEFDVDLSDVWARAERLGVTNFADTTPEEHRLAMVHLRSAKVGDMSQALPGTSRLLTLVRLADALASARSVREHSTAGGYLSGLSPALVRQKQAFYYHELDDYRGLSTQLAHQAVSTLLEEEAGLWPLLYFANGVLYIGAADAPLPTKDSAVNRVVEILFNSVSWSARDRAYDIARGALKSAQTVKFQGYVYLFAGVARLLEVIRDRAARDRVPQKFATDVAQKRVDTGKYASISAFFETFDLPETVPDSDLVAKWWSATEFLKGAESIVRDHAGDGTALQCLFDTLATPDQVRSAMAAARRDGRCRGTAR